MHMNTPHTASLSLQESITNAFSARTRPDDHDLGAADGIQQPRNDPESFALIEAFRGLPWQAVDANMVRTFKDALPLFTPAAFAYYVPAYMLACLKAPEAVDTAFDAVIFKLHHESFAVAFRFPGGGAERFTLHRAAAPERNLFVFTSN